MGDRSRGDYEERFWRVRTVVELVKLVIWIGWETFSGGPGRLL